eukprot:g3781.t1
MNFTQTTFEANHVKRFGGALFVYQSNATFRNTTVRNNKALWTGGGIYVFRGSRLIARNLSVLSNSASNGGGICVLVGSSILCYSCVIANNRAYNGAGMFVYSYNSIPIVAQLQNSQFENNSAQSYGGGMVFLAPSSRSINCTNTSVICDYVILLNTSFVRNYAYYSGAAIISTYASAVLVDCDYKGKRREFLNQDDFKSLEPLNPNKLCPSWIENRAHLKIHGDIFRIYGGGTVLTVKSDEEVRLVGDANNGYVLENVSSGRRLPIIYIKILDEFGVGTLPNLPNLFEARLSSQDGFIHREYPTNILARSGSFSEVIGFASPGNYTLEIKFNYSDLATVNLTVIVRECTVGEELLSNELVCQKCDAVSYNLNASGLGGCTQCPYGGDCRGKYIIPKKGYWHKSPCHNIVQKCLVEEACSYEKRQEKLMNFANDYENCTANTTGLVAYNDVLCHEGYKGSLCGSCNGSFGLSGTFLCSRCSSTLLSLLTIFAIATYLLGAAAFTIRGCLPFTINTHDYSSSSDQLSHDAGPLTRDSQVNIEMVKMLVEGYIEPEYSEETQLSIISQSQIPATQQEDEYELTRWRTTEIFKIMINFLQTTAVAANVNVQWTNGMLSLFESSEYLGVLATAAISKPVDCLVSSKSAISRAIWRMSGSSSRRHVLQRQSQSGSENETPCRLNEDDVRQFYNQSSRQWLITDAVLDAVSNDVQSIIECAQENDTLLFTTTAVVTPARTLNLTKNLTLSSQDEPNLVDDEGQISTSEVARFTCPESGQLITSRSSSFTLLNIVVEGCNSSSSIIELDADCEGRSLGSVRFRHLVIEGNILTGAAHILNSRSAMCFHLELDDIRIVHNLCAGDSCLFLSSRNILNNIYLINNTGGRDISPQISVFSAREGSQITATNVTSEGNQIRSFYISNGNLDIIDSSFSNNAWNNTTVTRENRVYGGVLFSSNSTISIFSTTFEDNHAFNGGVIYATDASIFFVSQSNFTRNLALYVGALFVHSSSLTIHTTTLESNNATYGAAIYSWNATMNISDSTFKANHVNRSGGAMLVSQSNATLGNTIVQYNKAMEECGGICAIHWSHLIARNVSIISNSAEMRGGGIGIANGSSILCDSCKIKNNMAYRGAGLYAISNHSIPIVAQLQNSRFENNSAQAYGGGMVFVALADRSISCSNTSGSCGYAILLNTSFIGNYANHSGAIILTTHASRVLIDCDYKGKSLAFLSTNDFKSLMTLNPKQLCPSWIGNRVHPKAHGDIIGTYGQVSVLTIGHDEEVRLVGNTKKGYVLNNVSSGKRLPIIYVKIMDEFGVGPAPTLPNLFEARLSSRDGFIHREYPANFLAGSGNFSEVIGFDLPGNYTLEIKFNNPALEALETVTLTVIVRECNIGEELIDNELVCQKCDAVSYNFNPNQIRGCTQCPYGGDCSGKYIIPKKGYWHKSPCHSKVQKCLVEEACSIENRQEALMKFSDNYVNCIANTTTLIAYNGIVCHEGYKSLLCGSCNGSFGLSARFLCSSCSNRILSLLTIFAIAIYLLGVAAFTIRGCLPFTLNTHDYSSSSDQLSHDAGPSTRDSQVNIEMVKMLVEGYIEHEDSEEAQLPTASRSQMPTIQQDNEYELTRWRTTEIFKIMINFLQTTAIAANVNVQWTNGVLSLFESSEYLGVLATAAISKPVDCLISSKSALFRAIWRMLVSLFVPGIVIGILFSVWYIASRRNSNGWEYFVKRCALSVISVFYISYLGLTKMAVRAFYCIDVYDSVDYLESSKHKVWANDTSIRCYGKDHFGIISIAIFVLIVVTFCFPLVSSIVFIKGKESLECRDSWIFETAGFLFRAFKQRLAFWESVVMFRKACLSVIVVFSYPLGGDFQGVLASMLLLLSLHIHLTLRPYRKEFKSSKAVYGGAVFSYRSSLKIKAVTFKFNNAMFGGAFYSWDALTTITESMFQNNSASFSGGAICVNTSIAIIQNTIIQSNKASESCGGLCAIQTSQLRATNLLVQSNTARSVGGGMSLNASCIICNLCTILNNKAMRGAGLHIFSDNSIPIVAQLQNSRFENNSAETWGGGIDFYEPINTSINCSSSNVTCGHVILLSTNFVNNFAKRAGAAILSVHASGIRIDCEYKERMREDLFTQEELSSLKTLDPTHLCKGWKGNHVLGDDYTNIVGTYGQKIVLSIAPDDEVRLSNQSQTKYILENVNEFGVGPAPTLPYTIEARLSSQAGYLTGIYLANISAGFGYFSRVAGFAIPKKYNLAIKWNKMVFETLDMMVIVRKCNVDEESVEDGLICQACDEFSYNFNPSNAERCKECPLDASCNDRYIVPNKGYWHKSPCHDTIHKCHLEEACNHDERYEDLKNFTTNFTNCNTTEAEIEAYNDKLCNKGYKGPLCGSCKKSYGLSSSFECIKCGDIILSLLMILAIICYLLFGTCISISGTFPIDSDQNSTQDEETSLLETHTPSIAEDASTSDTRAQNEVNTQSTQLDNAQARDEMDAMNRQLSEMWKVTNHIH